MNYANVRLKDLIIGNMLGAKFTGYVSVGDEIASLPTTEMVAAINRATYPGYAKVSHDLQALKTLFLSTLSYIAILGIPASVGLSLSAPYLVPVMLGEKWLETIPLIQVLGIAYALICINSNAMYIFLAKGKPKTSSLISLFRAIIFISSMIIAIKHYGMMGMAYALLFTAIIMFPVYFAYLRKEIPVAIIEYISILWRPVLASCLMYVLSSYLFFSFELSVMDTNVNLVDLLLLILFSICIYTASLFSLWKLSGSPEGAEETIMHRVYKAVKD